MQKFKRQLDYQAKGGHLENEDWWSLVFDPDTNRFYVEHFSQRMNLWEGTSKDTHEQFEIHEYLARGNGTGQTELRRIISALFEGQNT